ncbi:family 43 glycosylhydrolase [Virgibacillus sp. CBA3643]|uniref:family 43 glycosylhydrolase n=1 Tax=Virgibacillus sp. CBA3643 TaxID=2942278 RepID=UPI0035A2B417
MCLKLLQMLLILAGILAIPSVSFAYSNPFDELPDSWQWDSGEFYGEGDPYVLKHNGTYYLYVSTVDDKSGVKSWTSEDLVNWEYAGVVIEEPSTKAAYAPEVTYLNGSFYMYTSPGGNGHYVYKSDNPLGPFEQQTENLGMGIDGHVFIDDDGRWYFYGTGNNFITAYEMEDPYTFGSEVNTGAEMNGWTEGATVFKRHGQYYMTYTGNHVWSNAYRINYATSNSPTENFEESDSQNPILINSEGSNVGLGHNSIVRGPDLDSEFMIYHSHAKPGRFMNIDRIGWNGDKMIVLGPTTSEQPDPEMPDFSDRFKREEIGSEWSTVNGGEWSIENNDNSSAMEQSAVDDDSWYRQVTSYETDANYTAEFNANMIEKGDSTNPRFGAIFSYQDEENYGLAVLSPDNNQLETFFRVDGVDLEWETSSLPEEFDYSALHKIRVEKEESEFKIYVDGMHKQTRDVEGLADGKIGYTTMDVHASFGYAATSNQVNGSNIFDVHKPLPGSIEAVHYNSGGEGKGYHSMKDEVDVTYRSDHVNIGANPEGGLSVNSLQQGEWLNYNVNIEEEAAYDFTMRMATAEDDTKVRLWLDNDTDLTGIVDIPNTGGWDQWQNISIDKLSLPQGEHTIKVEVIEGELNFSSFDVNKYQPVSLLFDDFNDGLDTGWDRYEGFWEVDNGDNGVYRSGADAFGKSVTGNSNWGNYIVEADIQVVNGEGDGGVLFRTNNSGHGTELSHNNPDMVQGYLAYINSDGVHLGKLNYDWNYLDGSGLDEPIDEWQHIKVDVNGTNIKVYVNDMENPKIDYTDHSSTAFTHGKVGVRSFYSDTKYDNFLVRGYPDYDSTKELLERFRDDGDMDHSLYKLLQNKLTQAEKHQIKGKVDQSIKQLNDMLKHLDKQIGNGKISEFAYQIMYDSVRQMIDNK